MSTYNPFISAFHCLTSDEAINYYRDRAGQDIGLIIWAVGSLATLVYKAGADMGKAHYDAISTVTEAPQDDSVKAIAATPIVGLLPAAKEVAPKAPKAPKARPVKTTASVTYSRLMRKTKAALVFQATGLGLRFDADIRKPALARLIANSTYATAAGGHAIPIA